MVTYDAFVVDTSALFFSNLTIFLTFCQFFPSFGFNDFTLSCSVFVSIFAISAKFLTLLTVHYYSYAFVFVVYIISEPLTNTFIYD